MTHKIPPTRMDIVYFMRLSIVYEQIL